MGNRLELLIRKLLIRPKGLFSEIHDYGGDTRIY